MVYTLRAGVVGAGVFGGHHARKLAAVDGVRLVGVYDRDFPRANTLAVSLGAMAFADYDAFLAACDCVTIATPAGVHAELGLRALHRGRHVYVEKPIATSLADADALIAAASAAGVVLQAGHQERLMFEAVGLPYAGAAPKRIEFLRSGPPSGRCEDVSVVLDLMVHDLDLASLFGFGEPVSIDAAGSDQEVATTMLFSEGRSASFFASRRASTVRRHLIADYAEGTVLVDFVARTVSGYVPYTAARRPAPVADPLALAVARFVAAVRGEAKPLCDGHEARTALDWALRIEHSMRSKSGRRVRPAARVIA